MPERRHKLLRRPTDADSFAERPLNFAARPLRPMDAFSQILSGVKLNGAVFFNAEFSAPWGFTQPASKVMAARVAPGAEHLVLYHLVIDGDNITGRVTSAVLSPTLNKVIGLAYLPAANSAVGSRFQIRIDGGRMVEAEVVPTPFYDPGNKRQEL